MHNTLGLVSWLNSESSLGILKFFPPESDDLSWFVFGVVPHEAADQFTFTSQSSNAFLILRLLI